MLDSSVLYIVLTAILLILTSALVTVIRAKTNIFHGDGGNDGLARARRGYETMLQFSVPFLALMIVFDLTGGGPVWIMWLSIVFLVTRLSHIAYMYKFDGLHPLRGIGTFGSHGVNAVLVVLLLMGHMG